MNQHYRLAGAVIFIVEVKGSGIFFSNIDVGHENLLVASESGVAERIRLRWFSRWSTWWEDSAFGQRNELAFVVSLPALWHQGSLNREGHEEKTSC
jgi:hypothetical protein